MKDYFDNLDQVFIKLYKKQEDTYLYWELWNMDALSAIIHSGKLGDLGGNSELESSNSEQFRSDVNFQIEQKVKEGYREISFQEQFTIEITFKLKTWGTVDDLQRREEIRGIVNENLGWTGNGICGDADIGSGEMTLFADVVDPYLAVKTIKMEFEEKKISDEYWFTISQGDNIIEEKLH